MPVSPVTPFKVIEVELAEGGTMVTDTTVTPVATGTVIVLKPLARSCTVTAPGEDVFSAAVRVCPAVTPEVSAIETERLDVTAISD